MTAPEELHLSEAAALVLALRPLGETAYQVALVVWYALTGLPEEEALAYAQELADAHVPVTVALPPF